MGGIAMPMFRLFVASLGFLIATTASAQVGGDNAFEFLNVVGSARQASLGGNQLALNDGDLNLAIFNPALLREDMHSKFALSYVNYFSDINYGYASYARDYDSIGTFAVTMLYLDYGVFTEADINGNKIGTFQATDYSLNLSYGRQLDSLFRIGATVKGIYSAFESYTAAGVAFDLAGIYESKNHRFSAAAMLKNIGVQLKTYNDTRESLPFELQAGVTYQLAHAPIRFGLVAENLQTWDLTYLNPNQVTDEVDPVTGEVVSSAKNGFGEKLLRHMVLNAEWKSENSFSLRFGFNYRRHQELKLTDRPGLVGASVGFGVRIKRFELSYGRASYHKAGASNHFTITKRLADFSAKN